MHHELTNGPSLWKTTHQKGAEIYNGVGTFTLYTSIHFTPDTVSQEWFVLDHKVYIQNFVGVHIFTDILLLDIFQKKQ